MRRVRTARPLWCPLRALRAAVLQIQAYFSGCLTALLHAPPADQLSTRHARVPPGRTLVIDVAEPELIPAAVRAAADQSLSSDVPCGDVLYARGFPLARARLRELADAALVITSRLHVASPAVAVGARVVFVPSRQKELPGGGRGSRLSGMVDFFHTPRDATRLVGADWWQLPRGPKDVHGWHRMRTTQWAALVLNPATPQVSALVRTRGRPPRVARAACTARERRAADPAAAAESTGADGGGSDAAVCAAEPMAVHFVWLHPAPSPLARMVRAKAVEAALRQYPLVTVWLHTAAGVQLPPSVRLLQEVGYDVRVASADALLRGVPGPLGTADGAHASSGFELSASPAATASGAPRPPPLSRAALLGLLAVTFHGGLYLEEHALVLAPVPNAARKPHVLLSEPCAVCAAAPSLVGISGCGAQADADAVCTGPAAARLRTAAAVARTLITARPDASHGSLRALWAELRKIGTKRHPSGRPRAVAVPAPVCASVTAAGSGAEQAGVLLVTGLSGGSSGGDGGGSAAAASVAALHSRPSFQLRAGALCHTVMASVCHVCHELAALAITTDESSEYRRGRAMT